MRYIKTTIIINTTDLRLEALEVPHVEVAACVEEEGVGDGDVEHGVEEHGQVVGPLTVGYQQLDDARAAPLVLLELTARGHLLHQVSVACLHAAHHHERVSGLRQTTRRVYVARLMLTITITTCTIYNNLLILRYDNVYV